VEKKILALGGEWERIPNEETERIRDEEEREVTFGFPILYTFALFGNEVKMKNIPPSVMPNFYSIMIKDPDDFLFEFNMFFHNYSYIDDTQKKLIIYCYLKRICAFEMVYGIRWEHYCILG